jgi:hypothetical protein
VKTTTSAHKSAIRVSRHKTREGRGILVVNSAEKPSHPVKRMVIGTGAAQGIAAGFSGEIARKKRLFCLV